MFSLSPLLSRTFLFVFLLVAYVQVVEASPWARKRATNLAARNLTTNAERLSRGLPPLPPRALYQPSRILGARTSQPSGVPVKRCITVTKTTGNPQNRFVGYVSKDYDPGTHIYAVNDKSDKCLQVVVPQSSSPFDITIDGLSGSQTFLGLATGPNLNYARPVSAAQSASPVDNQNSNSGSTPSSESTVWSSSSIDLSATWYPTTGSPISTTTFIRPNGNSDALYFAFDAHAFKTSYNDGVEVALALVTV